MTMKKIYTFGGNIGASKERIFDEKAKKYAKSSMHLDKATEKLMKETGRDAASSKMRIYHYRRK